MNTQKENVALGVIGAFLFSLVGGVVWFVLWQGGIVASLSGLLGVFCAIKGYALFAKKESVRGVVIATVLAVLVIIAAWYICLVSDVYTELNKWTDSDLGDAFELTAEILEEDEEVRSSALRDLGLGLLFCGLGCAPSVANALKRAKQADAPAANMYAAGTQAPQTQTGAARFCASCGSAVAADETFCANCGAKQQ